MTGAIAQISISRGGVPKYPIPEAIVTPLGIQGDGHNHPNIHGGLSKAVLLISSEVIDALTGRGYPLFAGALGENITTIGIDHRQWRSGQRYRLGQAVIELTTPRGPCEQLDVYGPAIKKEIYDKQVKDGDPSSPKWGMSGFYTSVVRPGSIRQGDLIALLDQAV